MSRVGKCKKGLHVWKTVVNDGEKINSLIYGTVIINKDGKTETETFCIHCGKIKK